MTRLDSRTRIWFPLFWFFESGGHVGRVRNEYEIPVPNLSLISSWVSGGGPSRTISVDEGLDAAEMDEENKKRRKKFFKNR